MRETVLFAASQVFFFPLSLSHAIHLPFPSSPSNLFFLFFHWIDVMSPSLKSWMEGVRDGRRIESIQCHSEREGERVRRECNGIGSVLFWSYHRSFTLDLHRKKSSGFVFLSFVAVSMDAKADIKDL